MVILSFTLTDPEEEKKNLSSHFKDFIFKAITLNGLFKIELSILKLKSVVI